MFWSSAILHTLVQWRALKLPKLSISGVIWSAVIAILVLFEILQFSGIIRLSSIAANFYIFMFSLVTISILAVIGAIFLGITIAHRLLESKGFTPFEVEMLAMKEQISEMRKAIDELLRK